MTYQEIQNLMIAAELARFGARTGVIEHLTGLASSTVRRLIRDVTGRRSPSGQLPYSTAWYERQPERMIHCALFLRLFAQESTDTENLPGRIFLNAYTNYCNSVSTPDSAAPRHRLFINRAHLAIQLLRIGELTYHYCPYCGGRYIDARDKLADKCQICRKEIVSTLAFYEPIKLGERIVRHAF